MTVVSPTDYQIKVDDKVRTLCWEGLGDGDTGRPVNVGQWADKSIHLFYTSGSGATLVMQGSNDKRANPKDANHASAVWQTLKDGFQNNISTTVNAGYQIQENYEWVRPTVTGGSSPVVNASLHMKRTL
jgi:hypothetical protein